MQGRPSIHATTLHVDELVSRALQGRVRVPDFQRGLRWRDTDVQALFDSIDRGFPIGTLLMWKRRAEAGEASFGPVKVQALGTDDAWWVVDGQQRLTSLVAGLRHPNVHDAEDPFVVYYDLDAEGDTPPFFRPHRLRPVTPYCLPLARCLEPSDFQQWLFDFVAGTGARDRIAAASDVATRLRNYRVPVYVVETEDPEVAREIFLRTNRAGRRMELHEVFAALAPSSTQTSHQPQAVARRLSEQFGPVAPNVVAKAAVALRSGDVTRVDAHPDALHAEPLMQEAEAALQAALRFLVACGVPHMRLLPAGPTPLVTLARLFSRHPAPCDRNLTLLRRWLWRGFFGESLGSDARTLRRSVVAVTADEDASVQALLRQVPRETTFRLSDGFDAREGAARLVLLALARRRPWNVPPAGEQVGMFEPVVEDPGDLFDWLQRWGSEVFTAVEPGQRSPASRFLTPGLSPGRLRAGLLRWAQEDLAHPGLASHLVEPDAARALRDGDVGGFVRRRSRALQTAVNDLFERMAEPHHDDRPALRIPEVP